MLSLTLVKSLYLTTRLQGIWGIEDNGKIVHEDTVREEHKMGPAGLFPAKSQILRMKGRQRTILDGDVIDITTTTCNG